MSTIAFLPEDFLWGFATASAQIEGGSEEVERANRGLSVWDVFCMKHGNIEDGTSTFRTANHFGRWKEDVAMLRDLGVKSYRFSLSWPRIIPNGVEGSQVNEKGVTFYSNLIDALLEADIVPFVTLFHWDTPQRLEEEYKGWMSRKIINDFCYYADVCYSRFGDRVKHWTTFNEPYNTAWAGYGNGHFAPGFKGTKDLWVAGHHTILAHAYASKLYRSRYQQEQQGIIGITLSGDWIEPADESTENTAAAQRKRDFVIGWFADPIYLGRYPDSMVILLGDSLPSFTLDEVEVLKGSSEFYGCNTYTTTIARPADDIINGNTQVGFTYTDGTEIGTRCLSSSARKQLTAASLDWLRNVPWGLRKLLNYLWIRYQMPIYITENGYSLAGEHSLARDVAIRDAGRVEYFQGYLESMRLAMVEDGVPVKSYFGWSLLDNFEWNSGLTCRFGVVFTDFDTFERTPKDSARYVCNYFKANVPK